MTRLAALVGVIVATALLVQGAALSAPAAKTTATIKIPSDGNGAVAHLVLQAKPAKGKKPKRPAKMPKLRVKAAPKGVAVVAASYKRDAKNKNRFHATVALTNPYTKKASRAASATAQDGVVVVEIFETDAEYVFVVTVVQVEQDVTYTDMPVMPWVMPYCDPSGSGAGAYLLGPPPAGVSPTEFLDYLCLLALDGAVDFEAYEELDLSGLVFDLDPFPGNPMEYYVDFEVFGFTDVNGVAFTAPPGHDVTALLPPTGFGASRSGTTATFGRQDRVFIPGTEYRANIRYDESFTQNDLLTGRITSNFGQTYSMPFPGHFTP